MGARDRGDIFFVYRPRVETRIKGGPAGSSRCSCRTRGERPIFGWSCAAPFWPRSTPPRRLKAASPQAADRAGASLSRRLPAAPFLL